jgi:hypothetical protein
VSTKEYHLDYQRRRYAARLEASLAKLGGRCSVCDSTEALEFHHVDQATKFADVTYMLSKYSQARIDEELAKCVLLCKEHHRHETTRQVSVEHGGGVAGKRDCRCSLCYPKKLAHNARRRREERARLRSSAEEPGSPKAWAAGSTPAGGTRHSGPGGQLLRPGQGRLSDGRGHACEVVVGGGCGPVRIRQPECLPTSS